MFMTKLSTDHIVFLEEVAGVMKKEVVFQLTDDEAIPRRLKLMILDLELQGI